jgi:hypothetical protein
MSSAISAAAHITNPYAAFAVCIVIASALFTTTFSKKNPWLYGISLLFLLASFAPFLAQFYENRARDLYRVQVTSFSPANQALEKVSVSCRPSGEEEKLKDRTDCVIPGGVLSKERRVDIFAVLQEAFLEGRTSVVLGTDLTVQVSVHLTPMQNAQVSGMISDDTGEPIEDAEVSVVGQMNGRCKTNSRGAFEVATDHSRGQQVKLLVTKQGYRTAEEWELGGDDSARIYLTRNVKSLK